MADTYPYTSHKTPAEASDCMCETVCARVHVPVTASLHGNVVAALSTLENRMGTRASSARHKHVGDQHLGPSEDRWEKFFLATHKKPCLGGSPQLVSRCGGAPIIVCVAGDPYGFSDVAQILRPSVRRSESE